MKNKWKRRKQNDGLFKFPIECKRGCISIFPYHLLPSTECKGLNGQCSVYIMIYGLSWNFETDTQEIQETQTIIGCILKEEFETTGRKNGSMFNCKGIVFWERKCQMYGLGKRGWWEWIHFSFIFFGGVCTIVFTKPAVTRDLFDAQTSADACWKGNALQNTSALLEFQQMALQVCPERMSTSFGTTVILTKER